MTLPQNLCSGIDGMKDRMVEGSATAKKDLEDNKFIRVPVWETFHERVYHTCVNPACLDFCAPAVERDLEEVDRFRIG